jgi:hypothetical protein
MTGMEAILERHRNELRVVLKLEMIGGSVSVAVGAKHGKTKVQPFETTTPKAETDV